MEIRPRPRQTDAAYMRARRQLHVTGGALHLSCHIDTSDSSRDGEREHHDLKYAYDNLLRSTDIVQVLAECRVMAIPGYCCSRGLRNGRHVQAGELWPCL